MIHAPQIFFEPIQGIHVQKNFKLQRVLTILESGDQNLSLKKGISRPTKRWVDQTLALTLLIESHNLSLTISQPI